MGMVSKSHTIPLGFVQCTSNYIKDLESQSAVVDGNLYFVLDTKQILLGKPENELVPMGKSTGVIFGNKEKTDLNNATQVEIFALGDLEPKYQDSYPQVDDLIFNVDGCLYRVESISGLQIRTKRLTVAGTGGGGGTSSGGGGYGDSSIEFKLVDTLYDYTISADEDVYINYIFTDVRNGNQTGDGYIEFVVNDIAQRKIATKQSTEADPVLSMAIPKSALIPNYANKVVVKCYNKAGAYIPSDEIQIKVIDLKFTPANNTSDRIFITDDNFINFDFDAEGLECLKQAVAELYDCNSINKIDTFYSEEIEDTRKTTSVRIDNLSYGVYVLKICLKGTPIGSPNDSIFTKKLTYKILCTKETDDRERYYLTNHIPLFASFVYPNDDNEYSFSQGETLKLYYMYYDPRESNKLSQDTLPYESGVLKVQVKNSDGTNYKTPLEITANLASRKYSYLEIQDYPYGDNIGILLDYYFHPYTALDSLQSALNLSYNGKDYTASPVNERQYIRVAKSEITNNSIETANLLFNLSAFGRTNGDDLGETWSDGGVTTTFSNMNWTEEGNGWIKDQNGETALRLNGEATATIDFKPFEVQINDNLGSENSETNVTSTGLTFEIEFAIRDINNRNSVAIDCRGTEKAGFSISADTAIFSSEEGDILQCKYSDNTKTKISFVIDPRKKNGVATNRFMYIYLNGVLSRVCQYNSGASFSQGENVSKIILGSPDCSVDIYSVRCYNIALNSKSVLKNFIADIQNQTDKTIVDYNNNIYVNGELNFSEIKKRIPVMVVTVDTATQTLPDKKDSKTPVTVDLFHNTKTSKISNATALMGVQGTSSLEYPVKNYILVFNDKQYIDDDQIPTRLYCLKADFAESTSTHNTQHGNYIHSVYDYNTPAQQEDPMCRTTIYGYPIVLFQKIVSTQQGVPDTYKFLGKYNFNYDRYSLEAFGLGDVEFNSNKKYGYELVPADVECWEIGDNTPEGMFLLDFETMSDKEKETWEERASISGNQDELIKMYQWVYYTNQNQATNLPLDSLKEKWKKYEIKDETYGFNTDSKDFRRKKFVSEFEDYFDKDACLFYYIYTYVALMIDQRAKNMNLCKWGKDGKWAPWFYDNDSCFGLNNMGELVYEYYTEDTEPDVYSGGNSVLWTNFQEAFQSDIKKKYTVLRNNLSAESFIDYFIKQGSDCWSESLYNEDARVKYLDPYGTRNDLKKALGTGEEHFKYFIENRIKYCDAKWNRVSSQNEIQFRANRPSYGDNLSSSFTQEGLDPLSGVSKIIYEYISSNDFVNDIEVDVPISSKNINGKALDLIIQDGLDSGEFSKTHIALLGRLLGFNPVYNLISLFDMTESGNDYIYDKNNIIKTLTKEQYNNFISQGLIELAVIDGQASIVSIDCEVNKIKKTLKTVIPSSRISLTANSNTYLNVIYGTENLDLASTSIRSEMGEVKEFRGPQDLPTNFNIKIPSADTISSVGDLSALYLGTLTISPAKNLKILKLGNDSPGYFNTYLEELKLNDLRLLNNLDISNCVSLKGTLELSTCPNLREIKAVGTNLEGITLSKTGQIQKMLLPKSFQKLTLSNQKYLHYYGKGNNNNGLYIEESGLEENPYQNLTQIKIENCPNINTLNLLKDIINNDYTKDRYVRISNIDWNFSDNGEFLLSLVADGSKIKGLTAAGTVPSTPMKPQLFGKCHFTSINGEVYEKLSQDFPGLELTYEELTSTVTFWIGGKYDDTTYEKGEYSHYLLSYKANDLISKDIYDLIIKIKNGDDFIEEADLNKDNYFTKSGENYKCKNNISVVVDLTEKAIQIASPQIITSSNSQYGQAKDPVYNLKEISAPIRLQSDKYTYDTFKGWSIMPNGSKDTGVINQIKGNTKLYAAYSKTIREYTVRFRNNPEKNPSLQNNFIEGAEIKVKYGECPTYKLSYDPTYPDQNAKDDYVFAAWVPSLKEKIYKDEIIDATYRFVGETKIRIVERGITTYPENNEIVTVGEYGFYNCTKLMSISLPKATSIKECAFKGCSSLLSVKISQFEEPCTLENINAFEGTPIADGDGYIFVPDVEVYKNYPNWEYYKNKIKSLSELSEVNE